MHEPVQASVKELHTNHELLLNSAGNTKDTSGITKLSTDNVYLRYYTKRVCNFKVQGRDKRLAVVIFNQNYEPKGAFSTLVTEGVSAIDWSEVFSIRGLSALAFIFLCVLLMTGNALCKDVLAADQTPIITESTEDSIPDGVHPYEGDDDEPNQP